ncbi:MAG: cation-transporting P-type ATPase, partial [Cyanobacteria bacterium P01_F01_bin.53]
MLIEARSRSFHKYSIDDIAQKLKTDLESGLTAEEIAHRYETYGRNELPVKPGKPAWLRFLL